MAEEAEISQWASVFIDESVPLPERYKAMHKLQNHSNGLSIEKLSEGFKDSSDLLKHELAYCLGQRGDARALPILLKVLKSEKQGSIVRHEAAEALGAIGDVRAKETLKEFETSPIREIAETCNLALRRLRWSNSQEKAETREEVLTAANIKSVDPAPSYADLDVQKLREILLNEKEDLFHRYRAMFTLRNKIANVKQDDKVAKKAVAALTDALQSKSGPLFRHEVAFVLGQVAHPASVDVLSERLADKKESFMVRHESAEALGNIGNEECLQILRDHLNDSERVIRETCILALHER
jgi:deoxyhypusine monooxygenase